MKTQREAFEKFCRDNRVDEIGKPAALRIWKASRTAAMVEVATMCCENAEKLRGSQVSASGFVALTLTADAIRALANRSE